MSSINSLSVTQLRKAAALKEKIEALEKEFDQILGSTAKATGTPGAEKKFKMSAAGRARISAAAKARWAKVKKTKPAAKLAAKPATKAKRNMSAAAKAKLSAKMKEIWAKRTAAQK